VTDDRHPRSEVSDRSDASASEPDPALEALRDILFRHYRQRISELEAELDDLEQRVTDRDALIATISPVLGDAIRRQIRDAREEMIEALYPIIGQLVVRAVSEAVQDLARTVDAQVRRSFDLRALWWRIRARLGGASQAEMSLRASLPFKVNEVFLIHRESGLLLWHTSSDPARAQDSELVSSMLTAIRDFAQDAFGRGREGQLEEIEYGDESILLEASRHAYLAIVTGGVEPPGFRAEMRRCIVEIEHAHGETLRSYDGDASALASSEASLRPLTREIEPPRLTATQRTLMAGIVGLLVICLAATCLVGRWALVAVLSTPTPLPVAIESTATYTPTRSPTSTHTPTRTPTMTPSATSTSTPTATPTSTSTSVPTTTPTSTPVPTTTPTPASVMGLMTGNVWLRQEPRADALRLGIVAERGQQVELLAVYDGWGQIHWAPDSQVQAVGWIPLRWVGTLDPIPAGIVTATTAP
jgi:hypothetical protein